MTLMLLTLAVFLFVVLIMAVGVIFKRPCLRGSCGGPDIFDRDGDPITCATCPNRKRLEAEAQERRRQGPLPTVQ
ncbi:MAG: DUF539 domain-containing protein [Acidobacteria bacterium]|nr:MAG: DUF539 domain-containing protein [Acidobacteriota bacterium]